MELAGVHFAMFKSCVTLFVTVKLDAWYNTNAAQLQNCTLALALKPAWPCCCVVPVVLGIHQCDLQGRFDPELALEADDIAEAAMLPLHTTALCVPKEMTLDTAQIVS